MMKMILLDLISEDSDMTNEEYEAYQMISYLTERITHESVNYLVIGDGIGDRIVNDDENDENKIGEEANNEDKNKDE